MAELPRGFRLLVVVTTLGLGGTERHLAAVLPELAARGARIRVVALRPDREMADVLAGRGIAVHTVRSGRGRLGPVAGFFAVLWHALAFRPHAAHFFLPEAYLVGGLATLVVGPNRRVMSRRGLNTYAAAHPRAAGIERWLHRRMDAVLGNSRAVCDELAAEGAPAERIALIPNGVVTGPAGTPREAVRARLGIAPDALVILCVANLLPYKGHADLIEAFARARAALPNAVLVLAGRDDGLGVAVMAQAEARAVIDHVRILGPRDDVPDLIGAADLFALASHEEGAPNAVIEAMAAGLPAVLTAVGGTPETIGAAGLLVPPHDPAALAEALVRLGSDTALRAALGRSAAARAAERFSLEACVARYVALYAGLAAGRAAAAILPREA